MSQVISYNWLGIKGICWNKPSFVLVTVYLYEKLPNVGSGIVERLDLKSDVWIAVVAAL